MTLDELELALTKLRDAVTPEGKEADRAALRQLLEQIPPEEARAQTWPRFWTLGPVDSEAEKASAGLRSETPVSPPDSDTIRRARREHLHEMAAPIRRFLQEAVSRVRGRDWLEQDWDNYSYDQYLRREWEVLVPFECLRWAQDGTVPVAAGRCLLGLPAGDGESSGRGMGFLIYWQYHKRFLGLCAEIGGRFFDQGGRNLIVEVLRRAQRLPPGDQTALLLRCAALGLTTDDPFPLARSLLEYAARDEFGARGRWVLDCVDNAALLPAKRGRDLLYAASAIARRTTALVASNPFSACLEALSEIDQAASLPVLVELLERAAYVKRFGWNGWQRALRTGAAAVQRLVAEGGIEILQQALKCLDRLIQRWPAVEAEMLLAGARGLRDRGEEIPEDVLTRATAAAEALHRWEDRGSLLIALGTLRAQQGERAAISLIQQVLGEILHRPRPQRWGGAWGRLLAQGVGALAEVSSLEERGTVTATLDLARTVLRGSSRWIALNAWAETLLKAGDERALQVLTELRQVPWPRSWEKVPLPVLRPFIDRLSLAGDPLANDMLPAALRICREAALGRLLGRPFATAFMGLAASATEVAQVAALIDTAWEQRDSWWSLALLALAGDALQSVEAHLLERMEPDPSLSQSG